MKSELDKVDVINKSIEELENDYWKEPEFKSGLTMMCYEARKKKINELSDEEIGTLIRQKIGLKYLLPLAVKKIEKYTTILNDFYMSDFLDTLLRLDNEEWVNNSEDKEKLITILYDSINVLNSECSKQVEEYLKENK